MVLLYGYGMNRWHAQRWVVVLVLAVVWVCDCGSVEAE